MSALRRFMTMAGSAAVCVGVAALLYVGLVLVQTRAATSESLSPVVHHRTLVAGESLGQLRIERLGLKAAIGEGERASVLMRGVGHLPDTPWIGQGGNVALAGHRDTVFRSLRKVETGDVIEIVTAETLVRYRVEKTSVVSSDDLTVLDPSAHSTLTLITCYPFSFFGPAPDRFIVRAREINP